MLLVDLFENASQYDKRLLAFWNSYEFQERPHYWLENGRCKVVAEMFADFLHKHREPFAEVVNIGHMVGKKKVGGWVKVDVPITAVTAFTPLELKAMENKGYDRRKEADRIAFAQEHNLLEDLKFIPHSWVEIRGQILDPTGFYKDGISGQFDPLVKSKANMQDRYHVFSGKAAMAEGVGRITSYNQTHDVGPNEITKQAAKFGFKVDKDGYPPVLGRGRYAKNTTPNKLMNLGLAGQ